MRIRLGSAIKSVRSARVVEDADPYAGCGADSPGIGAHPGWVCAGGGSPLLDCVTDLTGFSIKIIKKYLKRKG